MEISIFKAYDVRGKVGTELTNEGSKDIARAFADWLPVEGKVAVGYDMRPDSKRLAENFVDGLRMQGRNVIDLGQITSDMLYFAVGSLNLAGGAVITASHNPGEYNGIKLIRDGVIPVGLDSGLDKIRDKAVELDFNPVSDQTGSVEQMDISEQWVSHCLSFVKDLRAFDIAIDAGNGMAGKILPLILPKLPFQARRMYFELDGTFPNHQANPMDPDTLKDLIGVVKENKLDFGIAFDGDGDRAGFVDDLGRPVIGSDLVSIVAKYYLKKYPNSKIVYEVRTSRATTEVIKEAGGEPVRTKAGRISIGRKLKEINAPFGGETSGHLFFKENFDADSGLIAALVAVQAISDDGRPLSQIVDEVRKGYQMIPETNFEVANPIGVIAKLRERFNDGNQDELDGLTVSYDDAWFNVRMSNTEPLLRLNMEANTKERLQDLLASVSAVIQS